MKRATYAFVIALVLLFGASICGAAEQASKEASYLETATRIERAVKYTTSLDEFGHAVVQQALLATAKKIREEKLESSVVDIVLKFRVALDISQPAVPGGPVSWDPGDIDICYEMCTASYSDIDKCYAECNMGSLGSPDERGCDDIIEDFENASDILTQSRYLQELFHNNCVIHGQLLKIK
jgi:hypothetical protein